jgi:hypothetical protein
MTARKTPITEVTKRQRPRLDKEYFALSLENLTCFVSLHNPKWSTWFIGYVNTNSALFKADVQEKSTRIINYAAIHILQSKKQLILK